MRARARVRYLTEYLGAPVNADGGARCRYTVEPENNEETLQVRARRERVAAPRAPAHGRAAAAQNLMEYGIAGSIHYALLEVHSCQARPRTRAHRRLSRVAAARSPRRARCPRV